MKKTLIILAISTIVLVFTVGAFFYNKSYHEKIKSSPKMYAYQTFFGPPNSALIIESMKYKDSLITYYKQAEKGINPIFNFPLKTLPIDDPVYVVEYTEDSLLAKVVSYYDYGPRRGGSFTKGWVYTKCLHKDLPATNSRSNVPNDSLK